MGAVLSSLLLPFPARPGAVGPKQTALHRVMAPACPPPSQAASTLGYFDANCLPQLPSRAAQDPVQARWLWRWSAQQVRLPAALDLPEPAQ